MDFSLQESILEMKKVVAAFVAKGVDPRAKEIEEADAIPEDIVAKCKDMGLFGLGIPEDYGGLGLSMVGRAAILEEALRGSRKARVGPHAVRARPNPGRAERRPKRRVPWPRPRLLA